MRTTLVSGLALTALTALVACGGDDTTTPPIDAATGGFAVDGTIAASGGASVPATGHVSAVWTVSAGSDYLYKFGDGTSTAAQLDLRYADDPPAMAANGGASGFGVAIVTLYPASWTMPDGVVTEAAVLMDLLGASPDHAIIWKATGATGPAWLSAFPDGYSCGQCVRNAAGFDSFEPVACSAVRVDAVPDPTSLAFCNWT